MLEKSMNINEKSKLRIHKNLTYDILDGMADWVRVIDENGLVIYENETMKKELNMDSLGKKCYYSLGNSCPCKRCITETTLSTGVVSEKEQKIGDKTYSIKSSPVRNDDGEIYAVVEVFRDVTRERNLEKDILRKNRKMNKDLKNSRAIQEKILPQKGKYGSIKLDYLYKPSEVLSGDMFDIFSINDRYTGIYISDVVGHGVSASIMTMFIRQTMRAIKDNIISPSKALTELHRKFLDLQFDDDKYFTILYGVLDNKEKTFTFVNAGHNSIPIIVKKDGLHLLESSGYPICYLFDNIEYKEKTIDIEKGDKILFYTDGIIEIKNKEGKQFGLDRLIKVMENKEENLINLIKNAIDDFKYKTQDDDIAVLKAKVIE